MVELSKTDCKGLVEGPRPSAARFCLERSLVLSCVHALQLAGGQACITNTSAPPKALAARDATPPIPLNCPGPTPAMGFAQNLVNRIPSTKEVLSLDDPSRKTEKITPRLSFFTKRIRLKGNSKISIPLSIVLLFPCIVIILILVLFVRHPSSPVNRLIPAGAPPSIRYAYATSLSRQIVADTSLQGK